MRCYKLYMIVVIFFLISARPILAQVDSNASVNEDKFTKLMLYQAEKKSPGTAMLLSLCFPSAGHAYAGNWGRGGLFLLGQVVAAGIIINTYSQTTKPYTETKLAVVALPLLKIWEIFDSPKTADKYNKNLRMKYDISVSSLNKTPVLTVSMNF